MTTYSEIFGGGGGGVVLDYQLQATSSFYVVPYDGVLDVLAVAGAGSGAIGTFATGAGAGECAWRRGVRVFKGDTLTITIGAGGAGVTASTITAVVNGNNGTPTTITSSRGWSITVNGGKGGRAAANSSVAIPGGDGGTGGTGGDVHAPGGSGGDISAGIAGSSTTGGGAVNIRNLPAASVKGGSVFSQTGCTGGAGVGGRGGNISLNFGSNPYTSGGGYGGPAKDNTYTNLPQSFGPNAIGAYDANSPAIAVPSLASWGIDYFGCGGGSMSSSGPGGGSSGYFMNTGNTYLSPIIFGGSGGIRYTAGTLQPAKLSGCCTSASISLNANVSVSTAAAGDGLAVLILRKG